jgi:hypothetical protein
VVSPEEWEEVANVNQVLEIFNEVTNIVSGSDYPTTNLFLPEVCMEDERCIGHYVYG